MKFLLDQGIPRSTVDWLRRNAHDAIHVSDIGLAMADDAVILERGRLESCVVVTLDADFHALLALSGDPAPSTIRFRIEGLSAKDIAARLEEVIAQLGQELLDGAVVSVGERGMRSRLLPLIK